MTFACAHDEPTRKLATLKNVFISIFFSTQTSSTGRLALPFALASYLSPMHSLAALLYFTAGPADHMGTGGTICPHLVLENTTLNKL